MSTGNPQEFNVVLGGKYRTKKSLMVTCWWWYFTPRPQDSPSSSCKSVLPANEVFTIEQIPAKAPDRVLCRLDREEELDEIMIPKEIRVIDFERCKPTPFRVELSAAQINGHCERTVAVPRD